MPTFMRTKCKQLCTCLNFIYTLGKSGNIWKWKYATSKGNMLREKEICYKKRKYATRKGNMLQEKEICYRKRKYATGKGNMLQEKEICYKKSKFERRR